MNDRCTRTSCLLPLALSAALCAVGCFNGSQKIPGDATRFSPVRSLPTIKTMVGAQARLISLNAVHVRSDGTVDFEAKYKPVVDVRFQRPAAGQADLPVGAGGGGGHEVVQLMMMAPGMRTQISGGMKNDFYNRGVSQIVTPGGGGDVAPEPGCNLAEVWAFAKKAGAPSDAVATIRYDKSGYLFTIPSTKHTHLLTRDCKPR